MAVQNLLIEADMMNVVRKAPERMQELLDAQERVRGDKAQGVIVDTTERGGGRSCGWFGPVITIDDAMSEYTDDESEEKSKSES